MSRPSDCGAVEAEYKQAEGVLKFLEKVRGIPRVKEGVGCSEADKSLRENRILMDRFDNLRSGRQYFTDRCLTGGRKADKGHQAVITGYTNRVSKCKTIIGKQKLKAEKERIAAARAAKPKKPKRKRFSKAQKRRFKEEQAKGK